MENVFFFYPEVEEGKSRKVIAGVYNASTNTIKVGKSECSPKDRFCKVKGRSIALGRANCNRSLKIKEFIQKGKIVKTNKDLLPISISVDSSKPLIHQFIEVAKTL